MGHRNYSWMVRENLEWMMTGGTPIGGTPPCSPGLNVGAGPSVHEPWCGPGSLVPGSPSSLWTVMSRDVWGDGSEKCWRVYWWFWSPNCNLLGKVMIWLVVSTPLKNMKVNWDDEIPNIWENKFDVPNHQPVINPWHFGVAQTISDIPQTPMNFQEPDSQVLTLHVEKLSFDLFHLRLGDLIEPEGNSPKVTLSTGW